MEFLGKIVLSLVVLSLSMAAQVPVSNRGQYIQMVVLTVGAVIALAVACIVFRRLSQAPVQTTTESVEYVSSGPATLPRAQPQMTPSLQVRSCPFCGTPMLCFDVGFCPACGRPVVY